MDRLLFLLLLNEVSKGMAWSSSKLSDAGFPKYFCFSVKFSCHGLEKSLHHLHALLEFPFFDAYMM